MLEFKLADGHQLYVRGEHIESISKKVGDGTDGEKGKTHIMLVGKSGEHYILSLEENPEEIIEAVSKL